MQVVDPSVRKLADSKFVDQRHSSPALQFERVGYFVVDVDTVYDSTKNEGKLVFIRTVSLKEETFKKELTEEELAKFDERKAKTKADKEAKDARMKIPLEDFFRLAPDFKGLYSK